MSTNNKIKIYIKLDDNDIIENNYTINSNKNVIDLLEFLLNSLQLHIFKISKINVFCKVQDKIIGEFGDEKFKLDDNLSKYLNYFDNYIFKITSRKKNKNGNWEECEIIDEFIHYKENKRNKYSLEQYLISTRPPVNRFFYSINPLFIYNNQSNTTNINNPEETPNNSNFGNVLRNFINRINTNNPNLSIQRRPDNISRNLNIITNNRDNTITTQPLLQEIPDPLNVQEENEEIQETNLDHLNIEEYETIYNNLRTSYFSLAQNIFNIDNSINNQSNDDVLVVGNKQDINNLEKIKYSETSKKNKECSICLEELKDDDLVLFIKCEHNFHFKCLMKWLKDYSNKCPICRNEVAKSRYLNN